MKKKKENLVAWNLKVSKAHKAKAVKAVKDGRFATQSEYVRNLIDNDQ